MPIDFSDPNLDYSTAEAEMLRQQEAIKAIRNFKLLDSGAQPQPFQSAVTGTMVAAPITKRPLLSSLSPLIADTTAGREERELLAQRAKLNASQDAGWQAAMGKLNAKTELPGPPDPTTGQAPYRTMSDEDRTALLTTMPTRFTRYKEQANALLKEDIDKRAAATKLQGELQKERIKASKPPSPFFTMMTNDAGLPTGKFDARAGVYYDLNNNVIGGPPPGTSQASIAAANAATQGGTTPAQQTPANVPQAKPASADFQKQQAEALTRTNNAKDALALLDNMKPLFGTASQDPVSYSQDFLRARSGPLGKAVGAEPPSQAFLDMEQLALQAKQLAQYADRKMFGPQFTERDVKDIRAAVGAFESAKTTAERMNAYYILREIFERQADNPGIEFEKALQSRGEPKGIFGGKEDDIRASIADIKDPIERAMARRAYANQLRTARAQGQGQGAKKPEAKPGSVAGAKVGDTVKGKKVKRVGNYMGRPAVMFEDGTAEVDDEN